MSVNNVLKMLCQIHSDWKKMTVFRSLCNCQIQFLYSIRNKQFVDPWIMSKNCEHLCKNSIGPNGIYCYQVFSLNTNHSRVAIVDMGRPLPLPLRFQK